MSLLHYLSYAAILAGFAFVTLSLASGLLYVSELIEEHARSAKVVGIRGIYTIIGFHVLLYFTDQLPLKHILFSIFCHAVYLQNFSHTWPLISLTSFSFLASCVLVISDHFLWFFHFAHATQEARHTAQRTYRGAQGVKKVHGFSEIATFFGVCVWLAPLFLFLSLSANDNALPTSGAPDSNGSKNYPRSQRNSIFKSLFGNLPGISRSRRQNSNPDGIIAPRPTSPRPPPSPTFQRAETSAPLSRGPPPSPRSPSPAIHLTTPSLDGNSVFMLQNAPSKRPFQGARRVTADSPLGIGLRRVSSSSAVSGDS